MERRWSLACCPLIESGGGWGGAVHWLPHCRLSRRWWTWSGGYKWTRIDFENDAGDPFYFHHGATGCDGNPTDGFTCAYENVTRVVIDSFDAETQTLGFDIGSLFAGNDFDAPVDFAAGDFVKGCMAFGGDPECVPIFNSMGINFEDASPGPAQTVFSAM